MTDGQKKRPMLSFSVNVLDMDMHLCRRLLECLQIDKHCKSLLYATAPFPEENYVGL